MDSLTKGFAGKRVFVTGHTGFKGSWLSEWLIQLGAEVWGYSLPPPTEPALFAQLGLATRLHHQVADVRDAAALARAILACQPDFVFHLAAQPLVRAGYAQPLETWTTNLVGTVNLLDAMRGLAKPCAAVIVTTDKVYRPTADRAAHGEEHALGGLDPYSASKAAAEIAVASHRASFFPVGRATSGPMPRVALATARAGNVIGGGDWAQDRLVPDSVRALAANRPIGVRFPGAVRPWQHVLEPLEGYLRLAGGLAAALSAGDRSRLSELSGPFNFGPQAADHRTVRQLVEALLRHWPGEWRDEREANAPLESDFLTLDVAKADRVLGWHPRWDFAATIARTAAWYQGAAAGQDPAELTRSQIAAYQGGTS